MSSAQCRAARALLNWTAGRLSRASKVGVEVILEFERGRPVPDEATRALLSAYDRNGIRFLGHGEDGPHGEGLRFD